MKTTKQSIALGLFAMAALSFLLLSIPAEAYQNIHTLTSNDSVSTALPTEIANQTLYLHAKAPSIGYVNTRVHSAQIIEFITWSFNGECVETQGSFPNNHLTFFHTTFVSGYQSGTGTGMLTDSPKAKIADCDTGQND